MRIKDRLDSTKTSSASGTYLCITLKRNLKRNLKRKMFICVI